MQVEERIRRAEEIYNNRRLQNSIRVSTNNHNQEKQYSLFKKIFIQILICVFIYFVFYLIKNSNYIFSENVIEKTKYFLSYDINFNEIYTNIDNFYNEKIKAFFEVNREKENMNVNINNIEEKSINEVELKTNEITEEKSSKVNNIVNEVGIGGGDEVKKEEAENIDKVEELSQMEIDARDIKSNYNLIVPLNGVISSRFGPRTPTDIISANHEGIDIAADEGTVFIASMDGVVTLVSGESGYGNHICIENNDVTTLYAHCSKIYVSEGDTISQGQKIGEVGQTGNATGPHLHFEIRKEDRVVDPEYILEF